MLVMNERNEWGVYSEGLATQSKVDEGAADEEGLDEEDVKEQYLRWKEGCRQQYGSVGWT